jgi:hypothetical protein
MTVSQLGKMEIINLLAGKHGLKTYLEICTTVTGNDHERLNRALFEAPLRLMYLCPDDFSDGLPIAWRVVGEDISGAVAQIRKEVGQIDICLVDGHHDYAMARRDIEVAYGLLAPDGIMVVHDCLPTSPALASPEMHPGLWCGVAYKAFIDFVIAHGPRACLTVDCDYGCGIFFKSMRYFPRKEWALLRLAKDLRWRFIRWQWARLGDDYEKAFSLLTKHKGGLLRLISPALFLRYVEHGR